MWNTICKQVCLWRWKFAAWKVRQWREQADRWRERFNDRGRWGDS